MEPIAGSLKWSIKSLSLSKLPKEKWEQLYVHRFDNLDEMKDRICQHTYSRLSE